MNKQALLESYVQTKRQTKSDPTKPDGIKDILVDDRKFANYVAALSESIEYPFQEAFAKLAENTRINILENSTYGLNPYSVFALPLLAVYWPKNVAKEALTVIPMNKPDIIRGFLHARFFKYNGSGYDMYEGPAGNEDLDKLKGISYGPRIDISRGAEIDIPSTENQNIATLLGLTNGVDHIQRDFHIYKVGLDSGSTDANGDPILDWVDVDIEPSIDGEFSEVIAFTDSASAPQVTVVSGYVDYENMKISISDSAGVAKQAKFTVTASLEENNVNSYVKFDIRKIRLTAKDRQIQAEWSLQADQDAKALYDINLQAELVSVIGNQIATDIDRELINSIIALANSQIVPDTHRATFNKIPPQNFAFGPKQWFENIYPVMNDISSSIYNDTRMGAGNVILANPLDASILESTNEFAYTGTSINSGDVGYSRGTISQNKWTVLVSTNVPQGKMPILYKPTEEIKAVYIYAPYVPAVISPYPLGNRPSLTVMSRYATKAIRPNGIGLLTITNTATSND